MSELFYIIVIFYTFTMFDVLLYFLLFFRKKAVKFIN